ncbi:MAG: DUF3179 domain-containing (seleno)protein [Pseudomonadales bacterium]
MLFSFVATLTAVAAIFFAVLMTEPGQSLNLPREWVVAYYSNRHLVVSLILLLLSALWWLNLRYGFCRKFWLVLASVGVLLCIVAANFLLAALFPPYQYGANYVSVTEADKKLSDEQVVYAVEINGEAKGYPREHLQIPHIAGATIGGNDVVMTFCPLSNLPMVFDQSYGREQLDLGVLIQTNNNLLMNDRASGELIQQITGRTEFSHENLRTYPNTMMSWKVFKRLYPNAEVFLYPFDRMLDRFLLAVFDEPIKRQFSEDYGPIFPTLAMIDARLPHKEQVWGISVGGEQAAFTKSFLESNSVFGFELGGMPLLLRYDSGLDVVRLFERPTNLPAADIHKVDIQGSFARSELRGVPMHNGVFWMVWAHWFPGSTVFN